MLLSLALSAFAVEPAAISSSSPTVEAAVMDGAEGAGATKPKAAPSKKKKSGSTGGGRGGSTGSSSGSAGDKEEDNGDIKLFKKHKLGKSWKYQPYVMPGAGVKIDTGSSDSDAAGDSSVGGSLGADAGIKYWHKKWHGNLGLGGDYGISSAYRGYEVRLGNTFGNRQKYWGLDAGLEAFYNAYTFTDTAGSTAATTANDIEGSPGVSIPVTATIGPKDLYGVLGIKPSFPLGSDRGTVSNNMMYVAGIGGDVGGVNGQVYFVHQTINGVAFNSFEAAVPF